MTGLSGRTGPAFRRASAPRRSRRSRGVSSAGTAERAALGRATGLWLAMTLPLAGEEVRDAREGSGLGRVGVDGAGDQGGPVVEVAERAIVVFDTLSGRWGDFDDGQEVEPGRFLGEDPA